MGKVGPRACFRCLVVKPPTEYDLGPSGKRSRSVCRECVAIEEAARPPRVQKRRTWAEGGYTVRECTICGMVKRLTTSNFYSGASMGFDNYCKRCRSAQSAKARERMKGDPDHVERERERNRLYQAARRAEDPEPHRERVRAYRVRVFADPAKHARHLETRRMYYALQRERRTGVLAGRTVYKIDEKTPRLPARPVAEFLENLIASRTLGPNSDARERLCEALGIEARSLSAWRSGERTHMRFDIVDRILVGCGVLWFDVFDEDRFPEEHREAERLFDPVVSDTRRAA